MSEVSETHIPSPVQIPGVTSPAPVAQPVAPVAPVAPVVAPVVPVVPVIPVAAKDEPVSAVEAMNTGNAALDTAVNVFTTMTKATDADLERAAGKALEYSNADLVDMVFIKERFGEHADHAVQLIKAAVAEKGNIVARQTAEVHQLAGGQANWEAALSVYQTNAPDYIKAAVVALMDSGKAKEGTQMLLQFATSQGLNPGSVQLNSPTNVPGAQGALDMQGFRTELNKLRTEAGGRTLESGPYGERYQQLLARREQGRQLGR